MFYVGLTLLLFGALTYAFNFSIQILLSFNTIFALAIGALMMVAGYIIARKQ